MDLNVNINHKESVFHSMNIFTKIMLWGRNLFFPGNCALCGSQLIETQEIRYSLCKSCCISINPIGGIKCAVCGKPLISEQGSCLPCRNTAEHSHDRLWAMFPYIGKYRKLLTAYKFHKNMALAVFFAQKIAELIVNEPLLKDAVIVPVPPRPGKIKHSGWDQVDKLVMRLKKALIDYPVVHCLKRRKSMAQKELNRAERLNNLKDKIYLKSKTSLITGGSEGIAAKTVILIDDVITTGSTMEVCSSVLKNAGAEHVYGICLFYD